MSAPTRSSAAPPSQRYSIAVRELCDFAAKRGDLDLRFTPSPTSQQGIDGHRTVVARRGPPYQREVRVQGVYKQLTVVGRADGFDANAALLEEIKTHKGRVDRIPDNHRALHWAQAKVYAALLCEQLGLPSMTVSIVYFQLGSEQETPFVQAFSRETLQRFFEDLCDRFLAWADQELAHRKARDATLEALKFPHATYRTGQRTLAENTFRAARLERCLIAQAPTGIGKTVGCLFPVLKASPEQALDKVYFLTAKTNGRALALDAVAQLAGASAAWPLRVIELVARDKACVHPDKACHGESCPLARGFFDRLPQARADAVQALTLDRNAVAGHASDETSRPAALVAAVAAKHAVCPYYLNQELVRWADVVVADYNYYFDSSALLHALVAENQWRVALLVDEAHNLVDRARAMYSASLDWRDLQALRKRGIPAVKRALDRLDRAWRLVARDATADYNPMPLPAKFLQALSKSTAELSDHLSSDRAGELSDADGALQTFYFAATRFESLAGTFDDHAMFDVSLEAAGRGTPQRLPASTLNIRNVVPAPYLKPRIASAKTMTMFSATMSPVDFYMDMLGLPQDTAFLDVESPFAAEQLRVKIASDVSTRYQHRQSSMRAIAGIIARQYEEQPGNYLAFFSSYAYMTQAAEALRAEAAHINTWCQHPSMSEAERQAFLDRLVDDGCGIGFVVLGGAFAEGIDLPGRRLVGAFIATLGLPQLNAVNEAMRERMQSLFGAGYDYTYFYPGMRKVVQAAGRVIRTPQDRGSVLLLDDRFGTPQARALLPSWWHPEVMPMSKESSAGHQFRQTEPEA